MRKKINPLKNPSTSYTGMVSGIILAGGRSTRFGFNKIEIKIGTIPLFIDQLFKINDFCREIIIATSERNCPYIISELDNIEVYRKYYSRPNSFDKS
ncbi:MAG: NTP transferase domain-containing protein, partial [Actinobacteria bacterium]|nr:NTP transferase domain-containing protein [Actinomycetota bacterium]